MQTVQDKAELISKQDARAKELADKQAVILARREEQRRAQEDFQREIQAQHDEDAEERRLKAEKIAERRRRREAGEDVDGGAPREKKKREGGGGKKKKSEPRKGRSKSEISTDSEVDSGRDESGTPAPALEGEEGEEVDHETQRRRGLERMKAMREVCLFTLAYRWLDRVGLSWRES